MLGTIDLFDDEYVQGWAKDEDDDDAPVRLLVIVNGIIVARTVADIFRSDLEEAGIGSGRYGFKAKLPGVFADSGEYFVHVVREGDRTDIPGSPRSFKPSAEQTASKSPLFDEAAVVQSVYLGVLNRDAEPQALEGYGNALRSGMSLESFIAELVASPEFAQRGIGHPATRVEERPTPEDLTRLADVMERAIMTLAVGAAKTDEAR